MATTIGNTKVKVRVSALIERVEEVKAADEARFFSESAEYEAALRSWNAETAVALRQAAKRADDFEYDDYSYSSRMSQGTLSIPVPLKPSAPSKVDARHDKTLRMLRMVDDEQMVMTLGDDLARYL